MNQSYGPTYNWIDRMGDPEFAHIPRNHQIDADVYFKYNELDVDEPLVLAAVWNEMATRLENHGGLVEWSSFNFGRPTNITATRRHLAYVVDQIHADGDRSKYLMFAHHTTATGTSTEGIKNVAIPYKRLKAGRYWQPLSYCFRLYNEWYLLEIARSRRFWQAIHNRSVPTTLISQEDV